MLSRTDSLQTWMRCEALQLIARQLMNVVFVNGCSYARVTKRLAFHMIYYSNWRSPSSSASIHSLSQASK